MIGTAVLPGGLAVLAIFSLIPGIKVGLSRALAIAYLVAALTTEIFGVWHPRDALADWFFIIVALLSAMGLWYSGPYMNREAKQHQWSSARIHRYYALFLLFIASLVAVALWTNFLSLWLAMEGATLSSVVLVALPETSKPLEAAWKYVVVTEVGGLVALTGTLLILSALAIPLNSWHPQPHQLGLIHQRWALIGAYLALAGYGAKAGLAPFHTWLPDAHSEAPAPVSAMLSGLKLAAGLIIIYRLFAIVSLAVPPAYLKDALIFLGLLSLAVAASFLAFQKDLKRFWAYSSIEHIGLISLGMGFGGIALVGAALHIWTHAANKTLLFHNAGTVRLLYHTSDVNEGARSILQQTPWTGGLLALGSAGIVGLPPLAPFWSEWLILVGGFHQPQNRLWVVIAAFMVVIIFIAIARRIPDWLFSPGPVGQPGRRIGEPATLIAPSLVLGIVVVLGGIAMPLAVRPLWHHLVSVLGASRV